MRTSRIMKEAWVLLTCIADPGSGPQYNATSMHGRIEVHRSLDVDGDNSGRVDIVDVATLAFAFGSTPGKPTWNIAADLDNSGKIDILDVAFVAFYFGQPL